MNLKMAVSVPIQKNFYYMGEIEYDKKWLSNAVIEADIQDDDAEKMMLLSAVKQAFDSQVYIGPRCDDTGCVTKGKCPVNRRFIIILLGRKNMEREEKGWYSIMIHAYKTGDLEEAVFDKLIGPTGNPMKIELNAGGVVKGSRDQSVPHNMLEGFFAEMEDAQQLEGLKDIMKQARAPGCKADVIVLQSEDYQEEQ